MQYNSQMFERFEQSSVEFYEQQPISAAQALIFAGGLGSRARELTDELGVKVKHLLPINYSSSVLLDHSIETALRAGVGGVNLIVSYHTVSTITKHCQHNPLYPRVSVFEHDMPTAGVAEVFNLFYKYKKPTGPLIKLEGDEINLGFDLAKMYQAHVSGRHPITYLVTRSNESYRYKLFVDHSGLVKEVKIAPFTKQDHEIGFNLTGTFIINPSVLDLFLNSGSTLKFLEHAIAAKKLFAYPECIESINVNSPKDYIKITAGRRF